MWSVVSFYLTWLGRWAHPLARRFWQEDEGASMVEYAILVALIAVVALAAVQGLGVGIVQVFENILSRIQGLGR